MKIITILILITLGIIGCNKNVEFDLLENFTCKTDQNGKISLFRGEKLVLEGPITNIKDFEVSIKKKINFICLYNTIEIETIKLNSSNMKQKEFKSEYWIICDSSNGKTYYENNCTVIDKSVYLFGPYEPEKFRLICNKFQLNKEFETYNKDFK